MTKRYYDPIAKRDQDSLFPAFIGLAIAYMTMGTLLAAFSDDTDSLTIGLGIIAFGLLLWVGSAVADYVDSRKRKDLTATASRTSDEQRQS